MIIDRFGFGGSNYRRAKAFYAQALAPLGITLLMEFGPEQTEGKVWACGFGTGGKPEFWIGSDGKTAPPMHVAFAADTRAEVRAFMGGAAPYLPGSRRPGSGTLPSPPNEKIIARAPRYPRASWGEEPPWLRQTP